MAFPCNNGILYRWLKRRHSTATDMNQSPRYFSEKKQRIEQCVYIALFVEMKNVQMCVYPQDTLEEYVRTW